MSDACVYRGKSKGKQAEGSAEGSDFAIDVADSRFRPLLQSSVYAIDPTSTEFKPTPAMKQLLQQQQVRLVEEQQRADGWRAESRGEDGETAPTKKSKLNPVSELASKVKQKFSSKK